MATTKKEKLSKRTNRKQNFKKFIESDYTDTQAFLGACKNDENLLIYTCLKKNELQEYIDEMKKLPTVDEQLKYLVNEQPCMNATLERYNRCTESIAKFLTGYINYNGFKMANSDGDAEDWTSEFWAKYCKVCEFYRARWFYPEKLKKESTVVYSEILYKEFIYMCRMSITGERKHQAFLATQDQNSSLFKVSLDSQLDGIGDTDKTLADVIHDDCATADMLVEQASVSTMIRKALSFCKEYPDAAGQYDAIKDFYEKQDVVGFDKKTVVLGKIFLYKAGLVSPKILAFIKTLSPTYKARYNISTAHINAQSQKFKAKKPVKYNFQKKNTAELTTWKELILKKRGEI